MLILHCRPLFPPLTRVGSGRRGWVPMGEAARAVMIEEVLVDKVGAFVMIEERPHRPPCRSPADTFPHGACG